jgi:hypothetical protein
MVLTFAPVKPIDWSCFIDNFPTFEGVIDPSHLVSKRREIVRAAPVLTCCAITARISDWY